MKTHIDLFSGFALAAHWAGFTTEVFCEQDPFCQRVLRHHWPAVPLVSDIREFDGRAYFPCQPFSTAGKRGGRADDRFLWPEMLRVIREGRPHWIVGENVPGIINMALDDVLSDLENEGYATQALLIPACSVNAPHKRERVWIIAHPQCSRTWLEEYRSGGQAWESPRTLESAILRQEYRETGAERNHTNCATVADTSSDEYQWKNRNRIDQADGVSEIHRTNHNAPRWISGTGFIRESCSANVADPHSHDEYGRASNVQMGRFRESGEAENNRFTGRIEWQSQPLLGECHDGLPGRLAGYWDGDWERGIPRVATGIQQRAAKLKSLGNAIVPQVAYEILRRIQL